MPPDVLRAELKKTKAATNKPFGIISMLMSPFVKGSREGRRRREAEFAGRDAKIQQVHSELSRRLVRRSSPVKKSQWHFGQRLPGARISALIAWDGETAVISVKIATLSLGAAGKSVRLRYHGHRRVEIGDSRGIAAFALGASGADGDRC